MKYLFHHVLCFILNYILQYSYNPDPSSPCLNIANTSFDHQIEYDLSVLCGAAQLRAVSSVVLRERRGEGLFTPVDSDLTTLRRAWYWSLPSTLGVTTYLGLVSTNDYPLVKWEVKARAVMGWGGGRRKVLCYISTCLLSYVLRR